MSQKTTKRSRRQTIDEELDVEFKVPGGSKTKEDNPKSGKDEPDSNKTETNGFKGDSSPKVESTNGENGGSLSDSPKRVIQTRSRSNTPLIKTPDKNDSTENEESNVSTVSKSDEKNQSIEEEENGLVETNGVKDTDKKNDAKAPTIVINGGEEEDDSQITLSISPEVEPVLEKDEEEAIPELQFDENDLDLESEGSPNRCKTRRSQTRNVSTPKTPKLIIEQEMEMKTSYVSIDRLPDDTASGKSTPRKLISSNNSNIESESQPDDVVDLDTSDTYSSVSTDNISTRAVAGSDATRNADLTYQDSGLFDDNSFNSSPVNRFTNCSLQDALKSISSPRPTIHSDYRKRALQNSLNVKGDVYADYESVQRISSGNKRKTRSITPEESKRFKGESSGLLSYIAAPISNIRRSFSRSSTPKLVAYDNTDDDFDDDVCKIRLQNGNDENQEKKWCSIM